MPFSISAMFLVGDPRGNHPPLALVQYVNCQRAQRLSLLYLHELKCIEGKDEAME